VASVLSSVFAITRIFQWLVTAEKGKFGHPPHTNSGQGSPNNDD